MDAEGWALTFGIAGGVAGIVSAFIAWIAHSDAGRSAKDSQRSADAAEETARLAGEREAREREQERRDRVWWRIQYQPSTRKIFELVNDGDGTAYDVRVFMPDGDIVGPYVFEPGEVQRFAPRWALVRVDPVVATVEWCLELGCDDPRARVLTTERW